MTDDRDIKSVWRTQSKGAKPMTIAEIHARARRFNTFWRWGFIAEYAACAAVIAGFAWYMWIFPGWMIKSGCALVIAGTLLVAWRLHRRGPRRLPGESASIADFHRAELVRARDMLRSAWLWYAAPFLPGLTLLTLGRWLETHAPGRSIALDHLVIVLATIIVVLIFALIILFQQFRAQSLQRKIDELDAWRGEK